ncbi:membrane protein insertase YidC [Sinomicrobium weinanense]|uniref:Membrane protein insertase YidC n=1 Tax=Sinomicrobium weinanense TaxID=2842200 RepID=A0A926Q3B1_9FLAO|nr:membrane protein insertase YidC [Sinomicrobium weinanense]MBC9797393.1 membrane protein insertase YidC [Sinomicrobium weinanense]MBU3124548.1 membrane protein insertase YidC [Sinomicrobium weinanense]
MEEKKLDTSSIIGFVLIGAILIWVMYNNRPTEEEIQEKKAREEQVEKAKQETEKNKVADYEKETENFTDSTARANYTKALGAFGYSATLPSAKDGVTVLENDVLYLKINNKGGQITEAKLKGFHTYDSVPVYLVKDGNASFNLSFATSDNRTLNTQDLYFEPSLSGDGKALSMKLKVSPSEFLEYRYELKPGDYMIDFTVRSQGLNGVLNSSQPVHMDWKLKGMRHSKSITYENRYTRLTYQYRNGDKISKLSPGSDDDDTEENVTWISYRQHFFSSILVADKPFEKVDLSSKNLVEEESKEAKWTKAYGASTDLELAGGEINQNLSWFFGPTDVKILSKYEGLGLDDSIPFGWGIFGWINKHVFTPLYSFLSSFLPYGMAIIVMTILVRLLLSPVTYKSYLSQAKMKVLRPEITEVNEKYKDDAMKKQQETMKIYNKAGVSPLSGCIPALLQLPIFYALFMFFPTAFALRQKSFLWADDLSSYDTIAELPFKIPFYGDHVSLFPILASIAILIYMMMTTGQNMQMQQQPGMPNMKFIMYLSPLFMLIFFNNYASGLSLYYFISNLITIFIMLAIKHFIIDEEKIHAKIEEKKKKPKKMNRFQRKMQEMMEEAQAQQKTKGKR